MRVVLVLFSCVYTQNAKASLEARPRHESLVCIVTWSLQVDFQNSTLYAGVARNECYDLGYAIKACDVMFMHVCMWSVHVFIYGVSFACKSAFYIRDVVKSQPLYFLYNLVESPNAARLFEQLGRFIIGLK